MRSCIYLLMCLFLSALSFHPALACEPVKDFWYAEVFSLAPLTLPEGIVISPSDPQQLPCGWIAIYNQNEQPLFVMSLGYRDKLVLTSTPDPDYPARLRLAHEVASYTVGGRRPALMLEMPALTDLDHSLQDRNVMDYTRPDTSTLEIPASQSSELLLVYNEQVIQVPFTLSYQINQHFNPNTCSQGPAGPAQATPPPATVTHTDKYFALGLLVGFLIALGIISWMMRGRK